MTNLADHYRHGRGIPASGALADEWLKKAADAGDPFASITRSQSGDPNRRWVEPPDTGNPRANTMLGFNLMHGLGVKADRTEAVKILEKAAEAGDPEAMANLAWAYSSGLGVVRDFVRSREWSEKAAARGHAASMLTLGHTYDYGCGGVTQDVAEARRWYEKAKAGFDPRARNSAEQALALLDRPDIHRVRVAQVRARGCMPPAPRFCRFAAPMTSTELA